MVAHEKALDWQELFELALQVNVSGEDLESMAYRVAGKTMLFRSFQHLSVYRGSLFEEALHGCRASSP